MGYKSYKSIKEVYEVIEGVAKKVVARYGDILEKELSDTWITGFAVKRSYNYSKEQLVEVYNFVLDSFRDGHYGIHGLSPERLLLHGKEIITAGSSKEKMIRGRNGKKLRFPIKYEYPGSFVYTKRCGLGCLVSNLYTDIEADYFFFGMTTPNIGFKSYVSKYDKSYHVGSIPDDRLATYELESVDCYQKDLGPVGFDRGSAWHAFSRWNPTNKKSGTWYCCDALENVFYSNGYNVKMGKAYSYINKG